MRTHVLTQNVDFTILEPNHHITSTQYSLPARGAGGGSQEKFSSQCVRQNFKTAFLCGPDYPNTYPFHTLPHEQPPTKTGLSTLLTFYKRDPLHT